MQCKTQIFPALSFNGDATLTVNEKVQEEKEAMWVFELEANPDPEFIWYHPSGDEVVHGTLDKYEMDVNVTEDKVKLIIRWGVFCYCG